jgi:hypothetical protein
MVRKQKLVALVASVGVLLVGVISLTAPSRASRSDGYQDYALAVLIAEIVECSGHPCLGDSEKKVRELLRDQILEDDCSEFSDMP